ncbi:MAG: tRNA preQ1(34) S-adenosylmethionine ribosyltransferase-isomerase QueA [Burkholderiales bacterium]|jgi:S-adenosylmethionine:tRNA ribosyltransferase-isomerase|nr:tRNA preQ1(34) S-adenosylmethionine ribosyltransferase-isomerase QueA [Burkholderiales bacterium]
MDTTAERATSLSVEDFDYELPPELVAQHPLATRSASRLMRLAGDAVTHHRFADLPQFVRRGDLLVFNDTKVVKARLHGTRDSGGKVEALIERVIDDDEALAHLRASNTPRPGTWLRFADGVEAAVIGREGDLFHLRFEGAASVFTIMERQGEVPLPPYIEHAPDAQDVERYQTVYARQPGAVAAPTAGLHFDAPLLDALTANGVELAYVTLHVGAGTFQPMRAGNIADHRMHTEWYDIPAATAAAVRRVQAAGGSVVAVGTTSLRALESSARQGYVAAGCGETDLFITPGYRFRAVDRLITNFHLPRSTLLMLVSAFAGMAPIREAYRQAVAERYRFFSYGDAMLIDQRM